MTTTINNYEMFTQAGEQSCERLVQRVSKKIRGQKRVTKDDVLFAISKGMKTIESKHPEVYDTEPAYHIAHNINKVLQEESYGFEVSRYDF